MSSPLHPIPALQVRERVECMCEHGGDCTAFAPGHGIHLIQARLASATPTEWVDAIVERVHAEAGVVHLRTLDGEEIALWNGAGAARAVSGGTPVSLHDRYHVLAVGTARFNVLRG
ncbi:hypothetical protein ACPW96_04685 [Micromonospora sp. DT81.3]|uniref:hypothetical protein n=1 Tax=Actinomycetes TaxID=1760 RepID=UPI003CF1B9E5